MRLYNAEQLILNLILEKDIFLIVKNQLSFEDFSDGIHRKLAEKIYKIYCKARARVLIFI